MMPGSLSGIGCPPFSGFSVPMPCYRPRCASSANPPESCEASPGRRPCTLFQYWELTTGMSFIVKYLFNRRTWRLPLRADRRLRRRRFVAQQRRRGIKQPVEQGAERTVGARIIDGEPVDDAVRRFQFLTDRGVQRIAEHASCPIPHNGCRRCTPVPLWCRWRRFPFLCYSLQGLSPLPTRQCKCFLLPFGLPLISNTFIVILFNTSHVSRPGRAHRYVPFLPWDSSKSNTEMFSF